MQNKDDHIDLLSILSQYNNNTITIKQLITKLKLSSEIRISNEEKIINFLILSLSQTSNHDLFCEIIETIVHFIKGIKSVHVFTHIPHLLSICEDDYFNESSAIEIKIKHSHRAILLPLFQSLYTFAQDLFLSSLLEQVSISTPVKRLETVLIILSHFVSISHSSYWEDFLPRILEIMASPPNDIIHSAIILILQQLFGLL